MPPARRRRPLRPPLPGSPALRPLLPALLVAALLGPSLLAACGGSSTTTSGSTTTDILQFAQPSLLPAYVGTPYSASVAVAGGVGPYSLRLSDGQLPAGLRLSGSTISGTPTAPGVSDFTLEVSDANLSVRSQKFSVTVATLPALSVALTLPGGEIRGETRLPLVISAPRDVRALRYRLTVPAGLRIVRAAPADTSAVGFYKVANGTLTFDLGFRRPPANGATVGLITVAPGGPMTLTSAGMRAGYTAYDAAGKSLADQPAPSQGSALSPSLPSSTPSLPVSVPVSVPLSVPVSVPTVTPSTATPPAVTPSLPAAPLLTQPVQTVPDPVPAPSGGSK